MADETCEHCGRDFDDEETYLRHLRDEHEGELGRIEQRRVAELADDDGDTNAAVYVGAAGALALVGLLAYVLFFAGGGGGSGGASAAVAQTPHSPGSVHYHGTITVSIGGDRLDFSQPRFQRQSDHFHFESGTGKRWHVHSQGVTLEYAMQTLGIELANDTLTYEGTTYGDDPNETVIVRVNGEPVDPGEYVLQEGDEIRIVARGGG